MLLQILLQVSWSAHPAWEIQVPEMQQLQKGSHTVCILNLFLCNMQGLLKILHQDFWPCKPVPAQILQMQMQLRLPRSSTSKIQNPDLHKKSQKQHRQYFPFQHVHLPLSQMPETKWFRFHFLLYPLKDESFLSSVESVGISVWLKDTIPHRDIIQQVPCSILTSLHYS